MRYLLGSMVLLWVLFGFAYKAADKPGDDFGSAFWAIVLFVLAVIVTVSYLGAALWGHRWL